MWQLKAAKLDAAIRALRERRYFVNERGHIQTMPYRSVVTNPIVDRDIVPPPDRPPGYDSFNRRMRDE